MAGCGLCPRVWEPPWNRMDVGLYSDGGVGRDKVRVDRDIRRSSSYGNRPWPNLFSRGVQSRENNERLGAENDMKQHPMKTVYQKANADRIDAIMSALRDRYLEITGKEKMPCDLEDTIYEGLEMYS